MSAPGEFDIDAYLARIGYGGATEACPETLLALHRAQAHTIPFENFDILLGRGVSLDPAALFDKLVNRRRGGYCFELNGLFFDALRALGFEARRALARVHVGPEPTARTHQLSLVDLGGEQWLADVGFGGPGLREPIPLEMQRESEQAGQRFRLMESPLYGPVLQTLAADGWRDLYSIDTGPVFAADIACGNHFTSTHPMSFFTFARVASLPTRTGRLSLYDFTLRTTEAGGETLTELEAGEKYLDALSNHFGIELDAEYADIQPPNPNPNG